MKVRRKFATLAIFFPLSCLAQTENYPVAECVGNLNVSFPNEIEIAANSANMLIDEHKIGSIQPRFEFIDGERAGFSSMYYKGALLISHELKASQEDELFKLQEKRKLNARKFSLESDQVSKGKVFQELNIGPSKGLAFRVGSAFSASSFSSGHMLWNKSNIASDDIQEYRKEFTDFIKNLSVRPIGLSPKIPGLCFPYFFARVDTNDVYHQRNISSTYRLKQHPDITIWIEDSSVDAKPYALDDTMNEFWSQYQNNPGIKEIKSEWKFPSTRKINIGRSSGLSSFVKILREDGVVDYGYMASAHNVGKTEKKASDIKIFLIQKSANAVLKGVSPMPAEELLRISQGIVSTINVR